MSVIVFAGFKNADVQEWVQLILYGVYSAGILTAIFALKNRSEGAAGFKQYFSEGFRCFIISALIMVVCMVVFLNMHPELKDQMIAAMRLELARDKSLAPLDIDNRVETAKRAYFPAFIMLTVFRYLVVGALVSVSTSAILGAMKKQNN